MTRGATWPRWRCGQRQEGHKLPGSVQPPATRRTGRSRGASLGVLECCWSADVLPWATYACMCCFPETFFFNDPNPNPDRAPRRPRRRGRCARRRWPRRRWTPRARAASPGALARTRWPSRRTPAPPPRRVGRPRPGHTRRQPAGVAMQCCGACRSGVKKKKEKKQRLYPRSLPGEALQCCGACREGERKNRSYLSSPPCEARERGGGRRTGARTRPRTA